MNLRFRGALAALLLACWAAPLQLGAQQTPAIDSPNVSADIISREVVVTDGETLQDIAARELGRRGFAAQLADFNSLSLDAPLTSGSVILIPILIAAPPESAEVVFVKGTALLSRPAANNPAAGNAGSASVFDIERNAEILAGDTISTGDDGYVSIEFSSGSLINLQPDTEALLEHLTCLPDNEDCVIRIHTIRGKITSNVNQRDEQAVDFRISTPYASAAVRGTVFDVDAAEVLRVGVTEGEVALEAQQQSVDLGTGFGSVVEEGQAPSAPIALLPAPVFKRIPSRMAPGDLVTWWPFEDASRYAALLANDEAGVESLATFETPDLQLGITSVQPGDYYLVMRAVDDNGLYGFSSNTRLTIADIDESIAPVSTTVSRQGQEYLVQVQNPPEEAAGFEIQIADNATFDDPLSVDVNATGAAVFRLDDDVVFARARVLMDPYTVSAFGQASSADD